ncbi:hypothetical protein LJR255_004875 [Pararhizobium sp. LjRoot255]|uniref:cytochrome c peroxidase n=1 Tax=Pararhizobium sp. LjRoot255 TaxID=3342298 RepID=UPI003ECED5DB
MGSRQISYFEFIRIGDQSTVHRTTGIDSVPADNPSTPEKAPLGKKLYFDPRLSATSTQSCANWSQPRHGWGDGLAVGVGTVW